MGFYFGGLQKRKSSTGFVWDTSKETEWMSPIDISLLLGPSYTSLEVIFIT